MLLANPKKIFYQRGGNHLPIDLSAVKAIDVHCHPYVPPEKTLTPTQFLEDLTLSVREGMVQETTTNHGEKLYQGLNMYMQITVHRLAKYLSCEPTIDAVVAKRNELAQDFASYTQGLFKDVHLEGLVLDYGYPTPTIPHETYDKITGVKAWEVYRIEPVMDRLREQCKRFSDFVDAYRAELKAALQKEHMLGLKTIIAYRSGLEIGPKDEKAAAAEYDAFRANYRATVKALRDYCLHIAMEECTVANKAMHIHTGIGDGEVLLHKASPSLLVAMLREEKYQDTKVHLVHGGYPWMEQAAFLCSVYPNIYMDISLQVPFAAHGVKRIIDTVFEFAPFNKVMYGSDAFKMPETNWLSVQIFKESFQEVLQSWVEKDYMDEALAQHIGESVLYKNFETLYL